ncbi:hypothetical protein JOE40_002659 [Arthrobacter sp. PvP102]|nr:hypothetical protein [Arthrobacter sp. PvP103]MBP1238150.1 hypothetical protein [Arthrobacter sp. PvP102]
MTDPATSISVHGTGLLYPGDLGLAHEEGVLRIGELAGG